MRVGILGGVGWAAGQPAQDAALEIGDWPAWLSIGVKNVGYLHLTNCDGTLRDGGTSKHMPCGAGHIDIAGARATLHEGGFEGWIMIDAWEAPDPYEASTKGKEAIDRALAQA